MTSLGAHRVLVPAWILLAGAACFRSHADGEDGAGLPDTAGRPCSTHEECDDGVFCNGVEWCSLPAGICRPGERVADFTQCRTGDGRTASCVDGVCDLRWEEICIPAGPFIMGLEQERVGVNAGELPEWPPHIVVVSEYCIDKYEITNRRYRRCMAAEECPEAAADGLCSSLATPYTYNDAYLDYPVTWLRGAWAIAACAFEGKRLPTEAEWEKAAKGGCELFGDPEACDPADQRIYPWGDGPIPCGWFCPTRGDDYGFHRVGSYPDADSPYGVSDMVANVEELTLDCDGMSIPRPEPYRSSRVYDACREDWSCVDPVGWCALPDGGGGRVSRGGYSACSAQPGIQRNSARGTWLATDLYHATGSTGARCVRSNTVLNVVNGPEEDEPWAGMKTSSNPIVASGGAAGGSPRRARRRHRRVLLRHRRVGDGRPGRGSRDPLDRPGCPASVVRGDERRPPDGER
jgi:formylglycine-generating enzyme required for sulfatase activity